MALDDQIALTLYDRIFEVIGGSDPDSGLPSAFESATTMFVMAQRGMALNSKDFTNPFSPGNPSGSIEAAANIANLADVIPDENHMYSPKAGTVSDVYSKMVRGVKAHEPPPSPEVQAKRDELHAVLFEKAVDDEGRTIERPSVLADSEQKGFNGFQDAYMAYMGQFIAAQKDPALKELWPIMGAQALQRPKRAFLDWAAATSGYSNTQVRARDCDVRSTFQAGARPPRCTMISAESSESRPSRFAVALRAMTRRPRPRGWQLREGRGKCRNQ